MRHFAIEHEKDGELGIPRPRFRQQVNRLLVGARRVFAQGPIHQHEGNGRITENVGQAVRKGHGFEDAVAVLFQLVQAVYGAVWWWVCGWHGVGGKGREGRTYSSLRRRPPTCSTAFEGERSSSTISRRGWCSISAAMLLLLRVGKREVGGLGGWVVDEHDDQGPRVGR